MNRFPPGTRPEDTRAVEVEIEIDATVKEVWPYLSTSEGLSSWYVGAEFSEQKVGATCKLTFGPGMVVPAYVEAYDVGERVRLGAPAEMESPRVEEYRVRAREGGGCVVRIVNWGFGEGAEWDAEFDAVKGGWTAFLGVLKQVVENFSAFGPAARVAMLSMGPDAAAAWTTIKGALGSEAIDNAKVGESITLTPSFGAPVTGTVDTDVFQRGLGLLAKDDDGGLILRVAVESPGGAAMISVGFLLFGERKADKEQLESSWGEWFAAAFPAAEASAAQG